MNLLRQFCIEQHNPLVQLQRVRPMKDQFDPTLLHRQQVK
jgi:hypothetical protein